MKNVVAVALGWAILVGESVPPDTQASKDRNCAKRLGPDPSGAHTHTLNADTALREGRSAKAWEELCRANQLVWSKPDSHAWVLLQLVTALLKLDRNDLAYRRRLEQTHRALQAFIERNNDEPAVTREELAEVKTLAEEITAAHADFEEEIKATADDEVSNLSKDSGDSVEVPTSPTVKMQIHSEDLLVESREPEPKLKLSSWEKTGIAFLAVGLAGVGAGAPFLYYTSQPDPDKGWEMNHYQPAAQALITGGSILVAAGLGLVVGGAITRKRERRSATKIAPIFQPSMVGFHLTHKF